MNLMKIGIQIPLYTLIRITNASNLGTHRVADPDPAEANPVQCLQT